MSGGARLTVGASSAAPAAKVIVHGATLSGNSQLTINPGTGAADPAASTLVSLSSVFSATLVKPSLPTPSQDAGNDNAFEWLGTVDAKA